MVVALLVHVPPLVAFDNVVFEPTHTALAPDIAPGVAFTVTILVTLQPLDNI